MWLILKQTLKCTAHQLSITNDTRGSCGRKHHSLLCTKKSVTRSTSSYKQNSTKICSAVDTSIHGKKRMQINRKSLWQKIFYENTEQSQTRGKKTQIPHSNPIKEAIFESHYLFLSDQQKISKGWKLKNSLINHQFDWTLN